MIIVMGITRDGANVLAPRKTRQGCAAASIRKKYVPNQPHLRHGALSFHLPSENLAEIRTVGGPFGVKIDQNLEKSISTGALEKFGQY